MIYIFGSNGFIGTHLTEYLKKNNTEYININRSEIDNFKYKLNQKDIFINLIGYAHGKLNSEKAYNNFLNSNILIIKKIMKILDKNPICKLIHISSLRVYVNSILKKIEVDDNFCSLPDTIYGVSKLSADFEILNWSTKNATKVVILRPPLVYGKDVKGNLKLLVKFCQLSPIIPFKSFLAKRSILSVKNLCSAIDFITKTENKAFIKNFYLIRDSENISVFEISVRVASIFKKKKIFIAIPIHLILAILKLFKMNNVINQILKTVIIINNELEPLGWKPSKENELNDFLDLN